MTGVGAPAVRTVRPDGRGPMVLICDHASNHVPAELAGLGLPAAELERHIGWDLGAFAVAERMSALLDAPLVHATVSRLVLDVNREPDHAGSIVRESDGTLIPGNTALDAEERARRVATIYEPFHAAIATQIRRFAGVAPWLVSIHSFTPEMGGVARPWQIGILSGPDRRLAEPVLAACRADPVLCVGDNEPYAPADGVYHTLDKAAAVDGRGLPSVMVEIRNDLIADQKGVLTWAGWLADIIAKLRPAARQALSEGGSNP